MPGAIVTLSRLDEAWTTRAGPDGSFRLAGLTPGSWALGVSAAGFTAADTAFEVAEDRVATAAIALAPLDQAVGDEIVVEQARDALGSGSVSGDLAARLAAPEASR